eukprot:15459993-Alexandrium_andersonii.AAC.1
MSASLVGSEMCIRDRCLGAPSRRESPFWLLASPLATRAEALPSKHIAPYPPERELGGAGAPRRSPAASRGRPVHTAISESILRCCIGLRACRGAVAQLRSTCDRLQRENNDLRVREQRFFKEAEEEKCKRRVGAQVGVAGAL